MMKQKMYNAALVVLMAGLTGCGGSDSSGGGGGGGTPFRIYVSDHRNSRIVRFDNMFGANWTEHAFGNGTLQLDCAHDNQGRFYVVESDTSQVLRYTTFDPNATPVAFGTAGSGVGQFSEPTNIAIDSVGRIYVVDEGNDRIVRMDNMTGANWVSFGSSGSGPNQFEIPAGIALDNLGRIYVADSSLDRIVRFDDMNGTNWTEFGTTGAGVGQFVDPVDILITPDQKMLIADLGGRVIQTDPMAVSNWQEFAIPEPTGVAMDPNERIYVTNGSSNRLRRYDSMTDVTPDGFGSFGTGTNQFQVLSGVWIGP